MASDVNKLGVKTKWQDLTEGMIIVGAGTSKEFKTGEWSSVKPESIEDKCKQCLLCVPVCPDSCIPVKDMKRGAEKSEFAEIGNGNLYWQGIIDAAKNSAVRHYVVEQDFSEDPMESIKISSEYLHRNFFE